MTVSLHDLEDRVLRFMRENGMDGGPGPLLAAVSGGPDSVALLHALFNLKPILELSLAVLHMDHGLRGQSSREDLRFTESLAGELGLPFRAKSIDVRAWRDLHGGSLEMAARECRHRFFREALEREGAWAVALGHQAEDQAEEVLLRLVRGTGPSGSRGMLPNDPARRIVRPLLFASREDILRYLRERRIPFRRDASNEDPFCLRNRLRLRIMPVLKKHFNPQATEALCRHARLVREEEDFLEARVDRLWEESCLKSDPREVVLDVKGVRAAHLALQRRLVRRALGFLENRGEGLQAVHVEQVLDLVRRGRSGRKLHLPRGSKVGREHDRLVFSCTSNNRGEAERNGQGFHLAIPRPGKYALEGMEIELRVECSDGEKATLASTDPWRARVDLESLRWPLVVRSWRPGDRFRPTGLGGSKKIQDFFTDCKVPLSKRRRIPLFCDGEGIFWVAGYRLDERVKITEGTKEILKISARPVPPRGDDSVIRP